MKINQLFESQEQLDEIGMHGVAKGIGAVSKVGGAVAGGLTGVWDQAKAGFQAGRNAVNGTNPPAATTAPAAAPAAPATAGAPATAPAQANSPAPDAPAATAPNATAAAAPPAETPQQAQAAKVGVGQINKIIPTLRTRDLTSIKKNVDTMIAKKQKTPAVDPNAAAAPAGGAGAMSQVANTLSNQGASSTGGQVQGNATGLTHTASPDNLNQQQNTQQATTPPPVDAGATATTATGKPLKKITGGKQKAAAPAPTEQDLTVAALKKRQAAGMEESFKFESKFLGMKI